MRWTALVLAILLTRSAGTWADDSVIGHVKTATGTVSIARAEQQIDAVPGTPLYVDDILETGADGSLGMTFKDNTILSIGSDSRLAIDSYEFQPTDRKFGFAATLAQGTLQYISGLIGKLAPKSVSVTTPAASITVRGARFLVRAKAGTP